MKQKLSYGMTFMALVVLVSYVFASVGGWNIVSPPNENWFSGSVSDPGWNWMKAADRQIEAGQQLGTGHVFYVDSGVTTASNGSSFEKAVATIDAAVNLCEDSRGDVIYVAQGHAETFITQALDVDVIGVTIIGLGNGSLAPTITYTHEDGEVAVGADNVTIRNIRFLTSVTGVKIAIDIEAGADYCTLENLLFWEVGDATGTDEFLDAVYIGNACINTTIQNCTFRAEAAGAVSAITSDNDTSFTTIKYCTIVGDYSTGNIEFATVASTDLHIISNILINGDLVADNGLNNVAVITVVDASGGFVFDNKCAADVATNHLAMTVFDDGVFLENYTTDDDGDDFEGTRRSDTAAVTASADG